MLCQTIHVWITYIQPTVTYIFCCYARPCLELITSNWWWRMSSLSHSSQWRMSSLSHSLPDLCYIFLFEKQTLSVSQTFVWCYYRFVFERQTLSASQTFVWRHYSILVHNLSGFGPLNKSSRSLSQLKSMSNSFSYIVGGYLLAFILTFSQHLHYLNPGKEDQGIEFNDYDSTEEMVKLLLI